MPRVLCIAGNLGPQPVSADVGSCWEEPGGCGVAGWQGVGWQGPGLGGQGLARVGSTGVGQAGQQGLGQGAIHTLLIGEGPAGWVQLPVQHLDIEN